MDAQMQLARENMIEQQIRPWEVLDPRVLDVFRQIPRHQFVPEAYRGVAYTDVEIPLSHGERMMKPVVEGRLLQALELSGSERVLEIGTGSGFVTACLARLSASVLSVEIHEDLAESARQRLLDFGIDRAEVRTGDTLADFQPGARFDAIAITGAVDRIPDRFTDWLAPNGRLFVVRGRAPVMEAVLVSRIDGDHLHVDSLFETSLDYLHGAAPVPQFVF
jgi:protein-L-isoaspartate(D-aspartate) O-methyltransferase